VQRPECIDGAERDGGMLQGYRSVRTRGPWAASRWRRVLIERSRFNVVVVAKPNSVTLAMVGNSCCDESVDAFVETAVG